MKVIRTLFSFAVIFYTIVKLIALLIGKDITNNYALIGFIIWGFIEAVYYLWKQVPEDYY